MTLICNGRKFAVLRVIWILNSAASGKKKTHSTLQSEGKKNTTSRNLLNVVTAIAVLDGTFILQQIQDNNRTTNDGNRAHSRNGVHMKCTSGSRQNNTVINAGSLLQSLNHFIGPV